MLNSRADLRRFLWDYYRFELVELDLDCLPVVRLRVRDHETPEDSIIRLAPAAQRVVDLRAKLSEIGPFLVTSWEVTISPRAAGSGG